MNDEWNDDAEARRMLDELLELRRAVAQALGREQYLHQLIDDAVESQYRPALIEALEEFERQPGDIKRRILEAAQAANEG